MCGLDTDTSGPVVRLDGASLFLNKFEVLPIIGKGFFTVAEKFDWEKLRLKALPKEVAQKEHAIDVKGKTFVQTRAISASAGNEPLFGLFVMQCLRRFGRGDWGDLNDEDKAANDTNLKDGEMVLAAYKLLPVLLNEWTEEQDTIWVVMDPGHNTVTVLYPSEY